MCRWIVVLHNKSLNADIYHSNGKIYLFHREFSNKFPNEMP